MYSVTLVQHKMLLSLQKPSLTVHLVFREILFLDIEATAVLLCCVSVTPDLQYNYSSYLASVL